MSYHTTVLLHEGVEALNVQSDGIYVDVTLGAGGHSNLILKGLGPRGRLFGFDQDPDAADNVPKDDRFTFCFGNFRFLREFLVAHEIDQVDGLIADLGVSGHQFDKAERGFSFRFDAPLDMRMNQVQEDSAYTVVNEYEPRDLTRIFQRYGESSFAKAIARRVVDKRKEAPIETTAQLAQVIESIVPAHISKGELAKIFQAIRIEVNQELKVLEALLEQVEEVIKPGGRLVVLSYHSLEDRMVKHFLRSGNVDDDQQKDVFGNVQRAFDPLGKMITPSDEEIEINPRARSARMRIGVKR